MRDVVIVGGGPAGLSAALLLGRCGRRVLLVDAGEPRNAASRGLHGFLTRDGIDPQELRRLGREQLVAYPSVELRDGKVARIARVAGGFAVEIADGTVERSRLILLATGRTDSVPTKPGFREFYGRGVYHCPFCDAWEHRGGAFVVYGRGGGVAELALGLLTWSPRVTVCADGAPGWNREWAARLAANGIAVRTEPLERLAGGEGRAREVVFAGGARLACEAVFFCSASEQRSALPEALGCSFHADHSVRCDGYAARGVPGLFVAGNVRGGLHLAIMAAAEGADAAIAINEVLLERGAERAPTGGGR